MPPKRRSAIIPLFQLDWDGYSPQEWKRRWRNMWIDAAGLPAFLIWYLVLGVCITKPGAWESLGHLAARGMTTSCIAWILALSAAYLMAVQAIAFPTPTADLDAFKAQTWLGRWIYLTRHAIVMQMWHQVLSAVSPASPWLTVVTHAMGLFIGTLGWFVSIQYFILVVPSAGYKEDCIKWQGRGVQFREVSVFVHVPPILIAILDVLVVKRPTILWEAASIGRTTALFLFYVIFYLTIIITNFKATGFYPYAMLKSFGMSLGKWLPFMAVQVCTLLVFFLCNVLLLLVRSWFAPGS